MPRPIKCRKVGFVPELTYFKPEGVDQPLEYKIKLEELEAMRLKDIENLSQEEAAKLMQVSRQTFQNIIDSARNKVALALTQGTAIKISGGHYKIKECKLKCGHCGTSYKLSNIQDRHKCPVCKSEEVICSSKGRKCHPECNK